MSDAGAAAAAYAHECSKLRRRIEELEAEKEQGRRRINELENRLSTTIGLRELDAKRIHAMEAEKEEAIRWIDNLRADCQGLADALASELDMRRACDGPDLTECLVLVDKYRTPEN